jgi:hypothetical protein
MKRSGRGRLSAAMAVMAVLLVTVCSVALGADRVRLRYDDGSNDAQTITIRGGGGTLPEGAWLREIQVDLAGDGASVDYSLTKRLCGADSAGTVTCGEWDPAPLAAGTLTAGADPVTVTVELDRPRDEYQLTLTVAAGVPTGIAVYTLYTKGG